MFLHVAWPDEQKSNDACCRYVESSGWFSHNKGVEEPTRRQVVLLECPDFNLTDINIFVIVLFSEQIEAILKKHKKV